MRPVPWTLVRGSPLVGRGLLSLPHRTPTSRLDLQARAFPATLAPRRMQAGQDQAPPAPAPPPPPSPPPPPPAPAPRTVAPATPPLPDLVQQVEQELSSSSHPPPAPGPGHPTQAATPPKISYLERVERRLAAQRQEPAAAARSLRIHRSIRERITAYLSKSSLQQRSEVLQEAFSKGYWDDLAYVVRHGPKVGQAPTTATPAARAPLLMDLDVTALTGERGNLLALCQQQPLTLVTYVFNAFGVPHVNSYVDAFRAAFPDTEKGTATPAPPILQMSIEESYIKAPVLWLSKPRLRRTLSAADQARYFVHVGSLYRELVRMGISNKVIGWVQLVDGAGRVRWQANGPATPEEVAAMLKVARQLLASSSTPASVAGGAPLRAGSPSAPAARATR